MSARLRICARTDVLGARADVLGARTCGVFIHVLHGSVSKHCSLYSCNLLLINADCSC